MYKVDLHIHTSYSDGLDTPYNVVRYAKHRGLVAIAITDHDTVRGYHAIKPYIKDLNILVIPGIEISTRECHVIGLGIDAEPRFPSKPSIEEALEWIKEHSGYAIIAHPYSCHGFLECPIVKRIKEITHFDAIEVINGRSLPTSNIKAMNLAKSLNVIGVAGSDAHRVEEIGTVYIELKEPPTSVDALIDMLRRNEFSLSPIPSLKLVLKNLALRSLHRITKSLFRPYR